MSGSVWSKIFYKQTKMEKLSFPQEFVESFKMCDRNLFKVGFSIKWKWCLRLWGMEKVLGAASDLANIIWIIFHGILSKDNIE